MKVVEGGKDLSKKEALHVTIGKALLAAARKNETPFLNTVDASGECQTWQYFDGLWSEVKKMETLIAKQMEVMSIDSTAKMRTEVEKWIRCFPEISNWDLVFDDHGKIPCRNGLVDPETFEIEPYTPDSLCTVRNGVDFIPGALSPIFDKFLAGCLSDKPQQDAEEIAELLQDYFGAGQAMRLMPREARKALLLLGGTRTGKTEIASIFRMLCGPGAAAPSVADISGPFGLDQLYGASAWVADDAVNEGDTLNPQKFKVIVTGEPVDIARKGLRAIPSHRFTIPVFLTVNALAKVKDSSDAVINRSLIVNFDRTIPETETGKYKAAIGVPANADLAKFIMEKEGPGVLNWALVGLQRVRERGYFKLPSAVTKSLDDYKNENNPIAEWADKGLVRDADYRVNRADLLCSFHGYQKETDGATARAWGGRYLFPRLKRAMPGIEESKAHGERFVDGLRLTEEGKSWWKAHNQDPLINGSKGNPTANGDPTNLAKPVSKF